MMCDADSPRRAVPSFLFVFAREVSDPAAGLCVGLLQEKIKYIFEMEMDEQRKKESCVTE